ncbi:hypothetical protein [Algibacter sp. R77976]|uniref:hypothetical protein n=1 Tax=Algibacter sp. R77976 TaxID=3093873 RepID=UPI0037CB66E7
MIKNLVIIASLLLSIHSFSQNLECCKTISEVKKYIVGDWKLEGDSKNVVYRFSFSKTKGFIEVLQEMNLPPKAVKTRENDIIINDHEIFNIQSKQGHYFIEIQSLYYEIKEQILVLNDTNFIYGSGDSKHVFIRDKS